MSRPLGPCFRLLPLFLPCPPAEPSESLLEEYEAQEKARLEQVEDDLSELDVDKITATIARFSVQEAAREEAEERIRAFEQQA